LAETSADWRSEAIDFIKLLGQKWRLDNEPANANQAADQVDLEHLHIDPRLRNQRGIGSQPEQKLTLQEEIQAYLQLNESDIRKHVLAVKEKNVPDHLQILFFWQNQQQTLPKLAKVAINLIKSGNSSSSQERNFGWSSLQTSEHRRSLKPRTILRIHQGASDVLEHIPAENNNKIVIE